MGLFGPPGAFTTQAFREHLTLDRKSVIGRQALLLSAEANAALLGASFDGKRWVTYDVSTGVLQELRKQALQKT